MTEPVKRIGMATFKFAQWCTLLYELIEVSSKLKPWEQEILSTSMRILAEGDEQEKIMAAHTIAELMSPATPRELKDASEKERTG